MMVSVNGAATNRRFSPRQEATVRTLSRSIRIGRFSFYLYFKLRRHAA